MKSLLAAIAAVLVLAGCATPKYVVSDVTRYHSLGAAPAAGQTFAIVAVDDDQRESLAFQQFADQINARLTSLGLRQYSGSGNLSGADYVVNLRYAVYGPTPDVRTRSSGFSAGFGFGHYRPWGYGGYGFGYDPWDHYQYTDTRQLFVRRVELDIYRGATYASDRKERVFEGRAVSAGLNGQIEPVMPYILEALFENFPGRSGETHTVSVEVPPEVERGATGSRPSARSSY